MKPRFFWSLDSASAIAARGLAVQGFADHTPTAGAILCMAGTGDLDSSCGTCSSESISKTQRTYLPFN